MKTSILQDALTQATQIILPKAIGTNLQDQRIQGIFLASFGLGLIAANCGVLKTTHIRPLNRKDSVETKNKSQVRYMIRWGLTLLGCAITCYGIYHTAMGFMGPAMQGSHYTRVYSVSDGMPSNFEVNPELCKSRLEHAKQAITACPESRTLWYENQPLYAKCVPATNISSSAMLVVEDREIHIADTNNNIGRSLLLELNNFYKRREAVWISNKKCSYETAAHYAREIESYEYKNVLRTYEISNYCAGKGFWPESWRLYQEQFSKKNPTLGWGTFEGFFKTQKEKFHDHIYEKQWYVECNPKALPGWIAKNKPKWAALINQVKSKR